MEPLPSLGPYRILHSGRREDSRWDADDKLGVNIHDVVSHLKPEASFRYNSCFFHGVRMQGHLRALLHAEFIDEE
jgi:hypothetical protein